MSREWKPGDVARIEYGGFDDIAVRIDPKDWAVPAGTVRDANVTDVHPLVVIDPEDREAVERLLRLEAEQHGQPDAIKPHHVPAMQAALREYANPRPPRPDEPQGLGAVVEDEDGARYTRVTGDDAAPWVKVPVDDWQVNCFEWDEFAAVRVLSPGMEVDQ